MTPFDIPGAPISDEEVPSAEVVDLFKWMSSRPDATSPNIVPQTGNASSVHYHAPRVRKRLRQARPTPLDTAVAHLATALDTSRDAIERSNGFDAWRDAVRAVAKSPIAAAPEFRELLGLMLASTHKKDAVDLDERTLAVLLDGTTRLKSRPAAIDVNRVSAALRAVGARTVVPLSVDGLSDEVARELEEIIEAAEHNRL